MSREYASGARQCSSPRAPWTWRTETLLTEFDLHLFGEGTLHRAFDKLGAHRREVDGRSGVHFAVWAPNAAAVSVIGDFNGWDAGTHPLRSLASSGIWETFVPNVADGQRYK